MSQLQQPKHRLFLATGNGWTYTTKAFIFSLHNKEGLGPFKSMVANPTYALYRYYLYGTIFGRGHDIYISNNANSNSDSVAVIKDYAAPAGVQDVNTILAETRAFSPDDREVFYIE